MQVTDWYKTFNATNRTETVFGKSFDTYQTHEFYKIHIWLDQEKKYPFELSRTWCSLGGLFGYDEENNTFIMKGQNITEFKSLKFSDKLDNVYPEDSVQNNLAIITKSKLSRSDSSFTLSLKRLLNMFMIISQINDSSFVIWAVPPMATEPD
ncbi:hypothetical protein RF11_05153 [Thelohanellus kitauei]|uniref:Uncharacterized protein n=1 Tax=Thelohanellus kitauei TaxID=669202 RepID=A0A0C2N0F9_THEKT|nr:hypothetical protein RF11_05153 [Thelohanellus kitauei]